MNTSSPPIGPHLQQTRFLLAFRRSLTESKVKLNGPISSCHSLGYCPKSTALWVFIYLDYTSTPQPPSATIISSSSTLLGLGDIYTAGVSLQKKCCSVLQRPVKVAFVIFMALGGEGRSHDVKNWSRLPIHSHPPPLQTDTQPAISPLPRCTTDSLSRLITVCERYLLVKKRTTSLLLQSLLSC